MASVKKKYDIEKCIFMFNLQNCRKSGTIKLPMNFTLSRECMKETTAAFKANMSIADVTREVFQASAPASSARCSTPTPTHSLALVPVSGGSRSATSMTSVPPKASTSFKAPPALKESADDDEDDDEDDDGEGGDDDDDDEEEDGDEDEDGEEEFGSRHPALRLHRRNGSHARRDSDDKRNFKYYQPT
ncbi:nucleolin-like [Manihot esculenta]|uniref:nucleolin-like n=1 Tax=Manihot esculenta TaxID=3983 RepID=UPI001CC7309D|nr:nucleolin-like [Manihot esculenta]